MEKYLNPYDKEYMRISMLKHEETFKEQVYELHRLYRIQKLLMRSVETNVPKNNARSHQEAQWRLDHQNGFSFKQNNISQPQDRRIQEKSTIMETEENFNEPNSTNTITNKHIDESEIELTLGLGPVGYNRTTINKKPETSPLTSDSGPSFSSSSTGSSHINRTGSLTKRTGSKGREGPAGGREAARAARFQSGSKSSIEVEEQQLVIQERLKQPSWLFQVLSLNMT